MTSVNKDYEQCLISAMINNAGDCEMIAGQVDEKWFYDPRNTKVFREICKQIDEKKTFNMVSLANALPKEFTAYLVEVSNVTFTSANWEFYANEIRRLYTVRTLKTFLKESENNLNAENVEKSIMDIDGFVSKCLAVKSSVDYDVKHLVNDFLSYVEDNSKKSGKYLGFDTGWDNFSDIIDGLELGKLMIIGARPSIGKSSFALQFASNLCSAKVPCAYFSLEMSRISLMTRLTSVVSGLPIYYLKHATTNNTHFYDKLNIALSKIYDYDLEIDDRRLRDEKELYSKIRYLAKEKGTKVFFVDHIGLIPYSNPMVKRVEQLDDITRTLLSLAQELNVTIICLCQLKRDSEGKKPTLADLRDSGAIEQNSDICVFLHRERSTGTEVEIPTEVIVIKNRDGNCGTAKMMFLPQQTKFQAEKTQEVF